MIQGDDEMNNIENYYQYGGMARADNGPPWPRNIKEYAALSDPKAHCGVILESSDPHRIFLDTSEKHAIVIGSSGSGKSRREIMASILTACGTDDSLIISDPKGELMRKTAGALQKSGFKCLVIDFRNPSYSMKWNPLAYAYRLMHSGDEQDRDRAYLLISSISSTICPVKSASEPYWEIAAKELIFALLVITVK